MSKQPEFSWNPGKVFDEHRREAKFVEALERKLTPAQKAKLRKAVQRLDTGFLQEKAELLKDDMAKILGERKTTSNDLLQRNVFSALDAIALHLDYSGFTDAFKEVVPSLLKRVRLDDPRLESLEWGLISDFFGGQLKLTGLGLREEDVKEVFRLAEEERSGTCGLPNITRKDFTFKDSFAKFCGRPDKILEVIHHSPGALKVVAVITIEILDLIAGICGVLSIIGWWLGVVTFVVSTVIVIVVACIGC